MTPEQATFLLNEVSLPMLKNEHGTTKQVIEAIPSGKGDYRPDPFAKSALELAWHLTAAEHRFLAGIAAGAFDFNPIHRPESITNAAGIAEWYENSFNTNFARLTQLTGYELIKLIDFRGIFQIPAVSYFPIAINHMIHHRGQLTTYLRPMGGKVPSVYGESYDTAEARKAAEAAASRVSAAN